MNTFSQKTYLKKAQQRGVGALICLSLLSLGACKNSDQTFDASGVFEADEVVISSESIGKILSLEVEEGTTLKEMAVRLGYVTPEQFDEWVVPEHMVGKI